MSESIFHTQEDRLAGAAAFMFLLDLVTMSRKDSFSKPDLLLAIDGLGRMHCGEKLWAHFKDELAKDHE